MDTLTNSISANCERDHVFKCGASFLYSFPFIEDCNNEDCEKQKKNSSIILSQDFLASKEPCKFLFRTLEELCGPEFVSDPKIMSLLYKKKTPNKYASDEWVGQEKLYTALERVLNELRSQENLRIFSQKVSTKEASDYYQVIKDPMNFSMMRKKLANLVYKSKAEFCRDIEKIVSNCLEYNEHPESSYRVMAGVLLEKSKILMKSVPDVKIYRRDSKQGLVGNHGNQEQKNASVQDSSSDQTNRSANMSLSSLPALCWNRWAPLPMIPLPVKTKQNAVLEERLTSTHPLLQSTIDAIDEYDRANRLAACLDAKLCEKPIESNEDDDEDQATKAAQLNEPWCSEKRSKRINYPFMEDGNATIETAEHEYHQISAHQHLERIVMLLVAQVGYSGISDIANSVLTDVYSYVIRNLALCFQNAGKARTAAVKPGYTLKMRGGNFTEAEEEMFSNRVSMEKTESHASNRDRELPSVMENSDESALSCLLDVISETSLSLHDYIFSTICGAPPRLGRLNRGLQARIASMNTKIKVGGEEEEEIVQYGKYLGEEEQDDDYEEVAAAAAARKNGKDQYIYQESPMLASPGLVEDLFRREIFGSNSDKNESARGMSKIKIDKWDCPFGPVDRTESKMAIGLMQKFFDELWGDNGDVEEEKESKSPQNHGNEKIRYLNEDTICRVKKTHGGNIINSGSISRSKRMRSELSSGSNVMSSNEIEEESHGRSHKSKSPPHVQDS